MKHLDNIKWSYISTQSIRKANHWDLFSGLEFFLSEYHKKVNKSNYLVKNLDEAGRACYQLNLV